MPQFDLNPTLLQGKRILFIGHKLFLTEEGEISTSCWASLKACGAEAIYAIVEGCKENVHWASRLFELGFIDDYNVDGLVQEIGDERPLNEAVDAVIDWLESKNIKVDVCLSVSDYLRLVQATVSKRLNVPSDSVLSVETAFLKDEIQKVVLSSSNAKQHGVKSYAIKTQKDLQNVLQNKDFPVIMKPLCGEGSIGCRLLFNAQECSRHLSDLKRDMSSGGVVSEKFAYKNEVVLMEYLKGTKYSIDVAICRGELVGGVIIQKGPSKLPMFYATTVSMPGDLTDSDQQKLIRAAFECCTAIGLQNGVYDVDMAWNDGEVPKLIEINPRPGGQGIKDMVTAVYGLDLFFINALLCCGIKLSPSDFNFKPRGHAVAQLFYFKQHRSALLASMNALKTSQKRGEIMLISPGVKTAEEYLQEKDVAYPLPILVVGAYHGKFKHKAAAKLTKSLEEAAVLVADENSNSLTIS